MNSISSLWQCTNCGEREHKNKIRIDEARGGGESVHPTASELIHLYVARNKWRNI